MPKISKSQWKKLGFGFVIVASVYSLYTYVRISNSLAEREMACFDEIGARLDDGADADVQFRKEYDELQLLVEYSLVARSQMLEISNRLRLNKDLPLSSRDLATLKDGTESYLGVRENLYTLANLYGCAAEARDSTLARYNITPKLRLKAVMLSLSAALTL